MASSSPVCVVCFEEYGREKAKSTLLLKCRCLEPSIHKDSIKVRVQLTGNGVLEPEIRPMPRVHFKGEFELCSGKNCKGLEKCTFPHCLKEKAAWNYEKYYGDQLSSAAPGMSVEAENTETRPQHGQQEIDDMSGQQLPKIQSPEPWPDFPGLGALNMKQLQEATSLASENQHLPALGAVSSSQIHVTSLEPSLQLASREPSMQPASKVYATLSVPTEAVLRGPGAQFAPRELGTQSAPRGPNTQAMLGTQSAPRGPNTQAMLGTQPILKGSGALSTLRETGTQHTPRGTGTQRGPGTQKGQPAQEGPRTQKGHGAQSTQEGPRTQKGPGAQSTQEGPRIQKGPGAQSTQEGPRIQKGHGAQSTQEGPRTQKGPGAQSTQEGPRIQKGPGAQSAQEGPRIQKGPSAQSAEEGPRIQKGPGAQSAQEGPRIQKGPGAQSAQEGPRTQKGPGAQSAHEGPRTQFSPRVPSKFGTQPAPVVELASKAPVTNLPSFKQKAGAAKTQNIPHRRKSMEVIYDGLKVNNYHLKFRELLKLEEIAHEQLLKNRCDGKHFLVLLPARQKPKEVLVDASPDHARFGYFKEMGSDEVSYATQSASDAVIKIGDCDIKCDILKENNKHAHERLYVAFRKQEIEVLTSHLAIEKGQFKSPSPLMIRFRLKYWYFRSLKNAIRDIPKHVIARILPSGESFVPVKQVDDTSFESYQKFCSSDQLQALKVIASSPASGPPILISGPFGTGKTRVLALAAHYFLEQSILDGGPLRILVCTQQYASADAYLGMYTNLTSHKEQITIIRLITKNTWRIKGPLEHYYKTDVEFKKMMERNSHRNRERYLVITTCLTAKQVADVLPVWFFTHIFLDEGAQMREPEAIAPLCMASQKAKIVIAGDKYQVGPAMLVLGKEPQECGLSISLLERLYDHYCSLGDITKDYCADLHTNFRCHRKIFDLARQVAYKKPLVCQVPDHSAHPKAQFPLQFVCTSLDSDITATESSIDTVEVEVALKEASAIFMEWPDHCWGKKDLSQICFLSPCRGQVTVARNTKQGLPPQVKSIQKIPTYQVQGQEFRALFISTSEPTTDAGETRDSTKSISDPSVFITALTRAQSLVVAVGNPFMLLKREEHMVKKYGDRGHCWSLFLKACLDNNSISVHCPSSNNDSRLKLLTDRIHQSISGMCLELPEPLPCETKMDESAPSINVIPDTPTEVVQFSDPPPATEEAKSTVSGFFKLHTLKEKLGKGGFGVVYHVQHTIDKKEYALKIVRLPDRIEEREKVEREVQAHARLEHPNIVRYCECWQEKAPQTWKQDEPWKYLPNSDSISYGSVTGDNQRPIEQSDRQPQALQASATASPNASSQSSGPLPSEGSGSLSVVFKGNSSEESHRLRPGELDPQSPPFCLCIKTELCDKATLKTWLTDHIEDRKKQFVTDCFIEVLDAVQYIHSKQLMHRDLKPSNIFFSHSESGGKIKVGDFGLVTTSQDAMSEAVSHSKYLGTLFYISPEQKKKKDYWNVVDIYALGIVYFEMNYPFRTEAERFKALTELRDRKKFPNNFKEELPHEAAIIEWMLTEDPFQRPSAEDVALSVAVKNLKKSVKRKRDANIPIL